MPLIFKILSHASNIFFYVSLYLICTVIFVAFNMINLGMLIPILQIIFGQVTLIEVSKPVLSFNIEYLKKLFQFYFQNIIIDDGNLVALYAIGITLILSVLLSCIFRYFSEAIVAKIRVYIVSSFRISIFDHVSKLGVDFFLNDEKNNIITNVSSDIQVIENSIEDIFRVCFKDPITIFGFFVIMYNISDRFTMFAGIFFPIIGMLVTLLINILRKNANKAQQTIVGIIDTINDLLVNIKVLETFNARDFFRKKFKNENELYKKHSLAMEYKKSLLPALSEFFGISIVALILIFGGTQIITHKTDLSSSMFITYIIILAQSIVPVKNITRSIGNVQRSFSAADRIFEILNTSPKEQAHKIHVSMINESLKIHNLSFSYDNKRQILKCINLEVKKGEKIFLTGKSGSGKSTLFNIIAGMQQNYQGNIFIDDKDLGQCDRQDLFNLIGLCSQKQFIIHDTVLKNLTFGKEMELSKIVDMSMAIHAHDFISTMQNGYDTILCSDDKLLSEGQSQRICLLRTLLKDPEILLLDEPTSALDHETEKKIIEYLVGLDKTIIMISHNLENSKYFDKVYNIDGGICKKT